MTETQHIAGSETDRATTPEGAASRAAVSPRERGPSLRTRLVIRDVLALILSTSLVVWTAPEAHTVPLSTRLLPLGLGALITWFAIVGQGLYRARTCSIRSIEVLRVGRAAFVGGVAAALVAGYIHHPMTEWIIASAILGFAAVSLQRGQFGASLRRARAAGRHCRAVVVIGGREESERLVRLLGNHPELGFRAVGAMGRRREGESGASVAGVPWIGDLDHVVLALDAMGVDSVIIASGDLGTLDLNVLVRELLNSDIHVQMSSGLWGVTHNRLRAVPLAHEPFLYLEPSTLGPLQRAAKRAADVVGASLGLLLAGPFLAIAAIAVRLQDRGPAIFRQERIGRDGRPFTLLKLRTMIPDADSQLVDLTSVNERTGGPLLKFADDPRRTRVGRVLERTSLDEVPQLVNVLRGDMSLVGPRPALPHEVEAFDPEFQGRHAVRPGITGLWQAEAREKPDFEVYRRLDLFYVENWSLGLDLAICLATVAAVSRRVLPRRFRSTR